MENRMEAVMKTNSMIDIPHADATYIMALFIVQSFSRVWLFATPWTAACWASMSFTISWSLLKLMSIESVMPSNLDKLEKLLN